jgi:hypothetical protein
VEKIAANEGFLEVLKSPLINVANSVSKDHSDQELWLKINQYQDVIEETLPENA